MIDAPNTKRPSSCLAARVRGHLEFNTFYGNKALAGQGTAIQCGTGNFTAKNNIMFDNGGFTNQEQSGRFVQARLFNR